MSYPEPQEMNWSKPLIMTGLILLIGIGCYCAYHNRDVPAPVPDNGLVTRVAMIQTLTGNYRIELTDTQYTDLVLRMLGHSSSVCRFTKPSDKNAWLNLNYVVTVAFRKLPPPSPIDLSIIREYMDKDQNCIDPRDLEGVRIIKPYEPDDIPPYEGTLD